MPVTDMLSIQLYTLRSLNDLDRCSTSPPPRGSVRLRRRFASGRSRM